MSSISVGTVTLDHVIASEINEPNVRIGRNEPNNIDEVP
jgi:hypothetical protein